MVLAYSLFSVLAAPFAVLVKQGLPSELFDRPALTAQKITIVSWLLMGTLLPVMYEQVLLSTLVTIRYESTVETIEDAADTELPFLQVHGTSAECLLRLDSRPGGCMLRLTDKKN